MSGNDLYVMIIELNANGQVIVFRSSFVWYVLGIF